MQIKLSRLKQIISEVVEEKYAGERMDDIMQSSREEEVVDESFGQSSGLGLDRDPQWKQMEDDMWDAMICNQREEKVLKLAMDAIKAEAAREGDPNLTGKANALLADLMVAEQGWEKSGACPKRYKEYMKSSGRPQRLRDADEQNLSETGEVDPHDQALDEMIAEEIEAAMGKFVVAEEEQVLHKKAPPVVDCDDLLDKALASDDPKALARHQRACGQTRDKK